MLTTVIRFRIALHSLEHHFGRNRNLVIQHGLMGSCKNFRYIVKSPVFSSTFNSFLIDARNHGTPYFIQEKVHIRPLILSKT